MSKKNCLFAFYVIYGWKFVCLLFMLFMSESCLFAFWCFLGIQKRLNQSRLFEFCAFYAFLCVKSFCKKKSEIIPYNLIYITTVVHFIEYCLLGFKKVRKRHYHKKWSKGERGVGLWSSKKFLIPLMFWTVEKRLFWVVNFIR